MNKQILIGIGCLCMLVNIMLTNMTLAQSEVAWNGTTSSDFNTVANWASDVTNNIARFNAAPTNKNVVVTASTTVDSLLFNAGDGYIISSTNNAVLTLVSTDTATTAIKTAAQAAAVIKISADLHFGAGAGQTQYIYSSKDITLSGNISGASNLMLTGVNGGILTLTGNNNALTGGFNANSNTSLTLNLGNSTVLGTGTFTWNINNSNGRLNNVSGGKLIIANAVSLNQHLYFIGSDDLEFTGKITTAATRTISVLQNRLTVHDMELVGALNKIGEGVLVMAGEAKLGSNSTVSAGTLLINGTVDGRYDVSLSSIGGTGTLTTLNLNTSSSLAFELDSTFTKGLSITSQLGGQQATLAALNINLSTDGTFTGDDWFSLLDWGTFQSGRAIDLSGISALGNLADSIDTAMGTNGFRLDGNSLQVYLSIPEPATWLLLGLGAVTLTVCRWRRRFRVRRGKAG
ncbi:MAG: PEP-CTERM sorting domain-containing protein [Verrucomicrobiales bacterium]|nr:PEP-CTERM sorting domain-containing protein [Verrucomicrobiales bacterium]